LEETEVKHKWHKEIKAWADGAEIEFNLSSSNEDWILTKKPNWLADCEYRIKPPQHCCCDKQTCSALKEPSYLYIWFEPIYGTSYITKNKSVDSVPAGYEYIGKIKLEEE
jgi:hypothetical protein